MSVDSFSAPTPHFDLGWAEKLYRFWIRGSGVRQLADRLLDQRGIEPFERLTHSALESDLPIVRAFGL